MYITYLYIIIILNNSINFYYYNNFDRVFIRIEIIPSRFLFIIKISNIFFQLSCQVTFFDDACQKFTLFKIILSWQYSIFSIPLTFVWFLLLWGQLPILSFPILNFIEVHVSIPMLSQDFNWRNPDTRK